MQALPQPRQPRILLPDPYEVVLVLDSLAPSGYRLMTWALTYPRFVHAELMAHRALSRNAASSRAVPAATMREAIRDRPALPIWWGRNQTGMQAREELSDVPLTSAEVEALYLATGRDGLVLEGESLRAAAKRRWHTARAAMLAAHADLTALGLHKQLANRVLEPWMPITTLVSATTFANWWHQRDHADAQPEIQVIATEMLYQAHESKPRRCNVGDWHLPFVRGEDREAAAAYLGYVDSAAYRDYQGRMPIDLVRVLRKVSVARCARVSYFSHNSIRKLDDEIALHDRLAATADSSEPGHFSPFEHVASAQDVPRTHGNFQGWWQYRKHFAHESGT